MIQLIIGNLVAFIASLILVYVGYIKDKKKILYMQTIQIGLFVVSNLILGGIAGAIINAISCIRNILCYKDKLGIKEKVIITILSAIFTVQFNNIGLFGYLPLVSTILYLWTMNTKDIIKFKKILIITLVLWFIYDATIKSYTSVIFDLASIVANYVSIKQIRVKKSKSNG